MAGRYTNDHLFRTSDGSLMPNSLRWFVGQGLLSFQPWRFFNTVEEFARISRTFSSEDVRGRTVLVFMSHEGCDDFAGFEVVDGQVTPRVLHFHPVFGTGKEVPVERRTWDIVRGEYDNLFEFVARVVLEDMREWASEDEFEDYFTQESESEA